VLDLHSTTQVVSRLYATVLDKSCVVVILIVLDFLGHAVCNLFKIILQLSGKLLSSSKVLTKAKTVHGFGRILGLIDLLLTYRTTMQIHNACIFRVVIYSAYIL
jgi:hypothetical protein